LLLANLFAGVYYNLSVWYKVTGKTRYGAYFSVFGALITITLNIILIPSMSYLGSAYATLFCYFSMCVSSYYVSRNHYPIPYNLKFIALYLFSAIGLYYIWSYLCFENNLANSISSFSICFVYILIVLAVEKKKRITFIS
jgi:O-antigen/teichoic acid export membrane protein